MKDLLRFGSALTLTIGLLGCARSGQPSTLNTQARLKRVNMEELRIDAQRDGAGGYAIDVYDAQGCFERGVQAFDAGEFESAAQAFDQVVREFASSSYHGPALFNAGLVYEALQRQAEATSRFEALIERHPDARDRRHAQLRLLSLYLALKRPESLERLSRDLLAQPLADNERLETLIQQCRGRFAEGGVAAALGCRSSLTNYVESEGLSEGTELASSWIGQALLLVGDIYARQAEESRIPAAAEDPQAQQRAILARAELMMRAQIAYFDAMYRGEETQGAPAATRIGNLYSRFWDHMMSLPVPFPENAKVDVAYFSAVYRLNLARTLRPLLKRAEQAWKVALAREQTAKSPAGPVLKQRLDALKGLIATIDQTAEGEVLPATLQLGDGA